jgi:hypothetical protein
VPSKVIPAVKKLKLVALDNFIVSLPNRFNFPLVPLPLNEIVVAPVFKVVAERAISGESALNLVDACARMFGEERATLVAPDIVRVDALVSPLVVAYKWKFPLRLLKEVVPESVILLELALRYVEVTKSIFGASAII